MIKSLIPLFLIPLLINGCLMPYQEDFTCNKGLNSGVCDSVSNVYDSSYADLNSKEKKVVEENSNECKKNNCEKKYDEVLKYIYLENLKSNKR